MISVTSKSELKFLSMSLVFSFFFFSGSFLFRMKNIDITVKSFQTKVHKVKFTRALIGGECQMIEEVDKLKRKFTIIKV